MEGYIIDQLLSGHSLTGYDTVHVGKVETKLSLLNTLETDEDLLPHFGKKRLDSDMIANAEQFLVKVLSKKYQPRTSFIELRIKLYHHSQDKRFIDLPCSSDAIQQNLKRAYLQTRLWLEAPFLNATERLDATDYGFNACPERNILEPCLFSGPQKPVDVPDPCLNCTNCVKKTCPCRVTNVMCSDYCGWLENECQVNNYKGDNGDDDVCGILHILCY